jgi:hypothetical protein
VILLRPMSNDRTSGGQIRRCLRIHSLSCGYVLDMCCRLYVTFTSYFILLDSLSHFQPWLISCSYAFRRLYVQDRIPRFGKRVSVDTVGTACLRSYRTPLTPSASHIRPSRRHSLVVSPWVHSTPTVLRSIRSTTSSAQQRIGGDQCPLCLSSHFITIEKCAKRRRHALWLCPLNLRCTHATWNPTHRDQIRPCHPGQSNNLHNLIAPSLAYPRHHPSATGHGPTSSINLCARSEGILLHRPRFRPGLAFPRHLYSRPTSHPHPRRPDQQLRRGQLQYHREHHRGRHRPGRVIVLTGGIG